MGRAFPDTAAPRASTPIPLPAGRSGTPQNGTQIMMPQQPMPQGDPNMDRRRMMLSQLLQQGAPQGQPANPMAGIAGGLQQAMARPDVQKWLMGMFGGARTGGPMQAPATSALPASPATGLIPGGV